MKIGFYPITWSTFFQLTFAFVTAWGGTVIKALADLERNATTGTTAAWVLSNNGGTATSGMMMASPGFPPPNPF